MVLKPYQIPQNFIARLLRITPMPWNYHVWQNSECVKKHYNIVYHQFQCYVRDKSIPTLPINTLNWIADIFTEPLL